MPPLRLDPETPAGPMPGDLPPPSAEEQAWSENLQQLIRRDIEAHGGIIDFGRFMELALYAPGLGYYSGGRQQFGPRGDFVTAPELGEVFARCLARQCAQILDSVSGPRGDVLEAGAGSGALAAGLLRELEQIGALPEHYFILELSAALKAQQEETIRQRAPQLLARVRWLTALPTAFRGVMLGNELLDAMPVERFRVTTQGVRQLRVTWEHDQFTWRERPADEPVRRRIEPLHLPEGYTSEVNLPAEAWMRSVAEVLQAGVVLLIDYGFPRPEFYHPQRRQGTLMCHYRHRAHDNPLILAGLQDITAHVDFTAVAEAGHDAGLSVLGYTSQAMFLLACGLTEIAVAPDSPADIRTQARRTHEINQLTSPAEMGELFKVMALGRGVAAPLLGFTLQDRRGRL
jgi:SAM-dependent MidA family methyltransferase